MYSIEFPAFFLQITTPLSSFNHPWLSRMHDKWILLTKRITSIKRVRVSNFCDCVKPIFLSKNGDSLTKTSQTDQNRCLDIILYTHNIHNCILLSRNITSKIGHFSGFPIDERVKAIRRRIQCIAITGSPTHSDTIRLILKQQNITLQRTNTILPLLLSTIRYALLLCCCYANIRYKSERHQGIYQPYLLCSCTSLEVKVYLMGLICLLCVFPSGQTLLILKPSELRTVC